MNFARQLKQVMEEKQMTQSELAAKIGKGKSSVSQYLSGKNVPKEDVKKKIAEVLDCDFSSVVELQTDAQSISVAECARLLGKSEQFVRVALQTGTAPFGFAVKNKSMYSYHISPKKLNAGSVGLRFSRGIGLGFI